MVAGAVAKVIVAPFAVTAVTCTLLTVGAWACAPVVKVPFALSTRFPALSTEATWN